MSYITTVSFAGEVAHKAAAINNEAAEKGQILGRMGSRVLNLTTAPCAFFDAINHFSLGVLTLALSPVAKLTEWCFDWNPHGLTFSNGLKHLARAVEHAVAVVLAPIVGLITPQRLDEWLGRYLIEKDQKEAKDLNKPTDFITPEQLEEFVKRFNLNSDAILNAGKQTQSSSSSSSSSEEYSSD